MFLATQCFLLPAPAPPHTLSLSLSSAPPTAVHAVFFMEELRRSIASFL